MAHIIIDFFVKVLQYRSVAVERTRASAAPIEKFIHDHKLKGGRRMVEAITSSASVEAQDYFLCQFDPWVLLKRD